MKSKKKKKEKRKKVREKMLYAASRATLTKVLGDNKFVDSLYGSIKVKRIIYILYKHL